MNLPTCRPCLLPLLLAAASALGAAAQEALVLPYHEVELSAPASGPIVALLVKEGDPVKAGQPLAKLYCKLQELEAARARAVLERREYEAKGARNLYDSKIIPESKALESRIELELARLQYETAAEELRLRTLLAPIDGIVIQAYREQGETVGAAQRVFRIMDLSKVYVQCAVPAERLAGLSVGQKLPVRFAAAEAPVLAEVVLVDPGADGAGLFRVRCLVDNPGLRIRSGVRATVELPESAQGK